MSSEDKEQFKVRIERGVSDRFRRAVSRKWGINKHGLLSHEVEQLLKFYDSVDGILPEIGHAHIPHQNHDITKYIPKYVHT